MNKRITILELSPLIKEHLKNGGEVIFAITGNSMRPMLHHRRDKVVLVKSKDRRLNKYDITLFTRPDGKYILHRVVAVSDVGYTFRGDNQYVNEYPVLPEQIVGVVTGFWRNDQFISCSSAGYQIYSRLWQAIYPLRWLFHHCLRLLNRVRKMY